MKLKYRVIVLMMGLSFSVKAQWTGTSTSSAADMATRLGRVGIGLSSTLSNNELHLKAINSSNADIIFETSAGKQWSLAGRDDRFALSNWTNATTSTDYLTILDGSGNIGIGTTSPNASLQFANSVNSRKIVLYESGNNDNQVYGFGFNNFILRYQVPAANTNHVFYAGTSATASNELMRIQGNGNVGIGTISPTALLHLYGNSSGGSGDFTNTTNPILKLQSSTSYIRIPHISADAAASVVYNYETGKNVLWGELSDAGNYYFRGRNILITDNSTSVAAASLHIAKNANVLLKLQSNISGPGNTAAIDFATTAVTPMTNARIAAVDMGAYNGALAFYTDGDGTANFNVVERMRISETGSVGIGTNPQQELHIKALSSSVSADILLQSPSGNQWQVSGRDDRFALMKSTDYFTVLNNGFVGIGTATPSVKLEVAGDIKASGSMLIGAGFPTNAGLDFTNSKLAVQGKIVATQIVSSVNAWQDRVFDEDYKLMSTTEVEEYIGKHKHLPDIPSEKEVLAKGIDLAEMNSLLLKKVEEQMLYIIRLEKRVTTLETRK